MVERKDIMEELQLEFTPTWIVALVCLIIVFISIVVERRLHALGKFFKKKNQKTMFEALQKVKEELMLLGFISLLLTVFQGTLQNICIPEEWSNYMLPCSKEEVEQDEVEAEKAALRSAAHYVVGFVGGQRRQLAEGYIEDRAQCEMGSVPLLSLEVIDQLHIFLFVLGITHVLFTVFTMFLAGARIRQWKYWEDSIRNDENRSDLRTVTYVQQFEFIQDRFKGDSYMERLLRSFGKQFKSVTETDYATMRLGFIMSHCKGNQKFDFHKYMVRALEADFKKVVGISWWLWIFAFLFLLMNVNGWHTYFWIAFIPLILLLAVGTKLELVVTQLAHDVAEKQSAIHGDLVVKPSDEHFWFKYPRLVLFLIHFILFQNAFEIAYFFFILTTFGLRSCIMGKLEFTISRLIIGAIIQILCSYSTLPLYAIVTQMGSSFKKGIFEDHVQESLLNWMKGAKKRSHRLKSNQVSRSSSVSTEDGPSVDVQFLKLLGRKDSQTEPDGIGP